MASTIIITYKNTAKQEFNNAIIPYVKSQGFDLINQKPCIFFTERKLQNNIVKNLIKTISSTQGFDQSVESIYYTFNLDKF